MPCYKRFAMALAPSHPVPPPVRDRPTIFGQDDRTQIVGLKRSFWQDAYTSLLQASWTRLLVGFGLTMLIANLLFATAYAFTGGVANARPGYFRDVFYF